MSARARERERENKREKIEEYITTNLQGVTSIMKCPSHAIARETRREIKLKRKKNIQRPASKRGEKKKKHFLPQEFGFQSQLGPRPCYTQKEQQPIVRLSPANLRAREKY